MADEIAKLEAQLKDFAEVYKSVRAKLCVQHGDDDDAVDSAMVEILTSAMESVIDELEFDTADLATFAGCLMEAVEVLDPSAFDDEDGLFGGIDDDDELEIDDLDDDEDERD